LRRILLLLIVLPVITTLLTGCTQPKMPPSIKVLKGLGSLTCGISDDGSTNFCAALVEIKNVSNEPWSGKVTATISSLDGETFAAYDSPSGPVPPEHGVEWLMAGYGSKQFELPLNPEQTGHWYAYFPVPKAKIFTNIRFLDENENVIETQNLCLRSDISLDDPSFCTSK
jgi:hypothetical protein